MKTILSVFLLLFFTICGYSQPVVLLTDWSKAGAMSYENTTILPFKGSGDYLAHDTVIYRGTWRVVDPNPGRTIMEFAITAVAYRGSFRKRHGPADDVDGCGKSRDSQLCTQTQWRI
jgi:hypothetical protein